jgi:hypothetical protein
LRFVERQYVFIQSWVLLWGKLTKHLNAVLSSQLPEYVVLTQWWSPWNQMSAETQHHYTGRKGGMELVEPQGGGAYLSWLSQSSSLEDVMLKLGFEACGRYNREFFFAWPKAGRMPLF